MIDTIHSLSIKVPTQKGGSSPWARWSCWCGSIQAVWLVYRQTWLDSLGEQSRTHVWSESITKRFASSNVGQIRPTNLPIDGWVKVEPASCFYIVKIASLTNCDSGHEPIQLINSLWVQAKFLEWDKPTSCPRPLNTLGWRSSQANPLKKTERGGGEKKKFWFHFIEPICVPILD